MAARVRVAPGPPGRCGSGSRPGRRTAPSIGAAGPGPREGPGPGRRSPPGPHADTCRPWPGSPSSRGPGWSGRCPPPSTAAPAPPEPGRWPPSATASRRAPCGGPPTTGRWRGRWTREHPKWQDRTPARGPPGSEFNWSEHTIPGGSRAHHPHPPPNPSRTTAPIPGSGPPVLVRKAQCRLYLIWHWITPDVIKGLNPWKNNE